MADLLAFNLTEGRIHRQPRSFTDPDLSTKLKLLGVEVASFGDCFADVFGPKWLPDGTSGPDKKDQVKALTYKDPFGQVYKKYLFTLDGKYLLGGMMMGDAKDYVKLLAITKQHKRLEVLPGELIIGKPGGDEAVDDLYDAHNLSNISIFLTIAIDTMTHRFALATTSLRKALLRRSERAHVRALAM